MANNIAPLTNIDRINARLQAAETFHSSVEILIFGRSYKVVRAQWNDDYDEGFELVVTRVSEENMFTEIQKSRGRLPIPKEVVISPSIIYQNRFLRELESYVLRKNTCYVLSGEN